MTLIISFILKHWKLFAFGVAVLAALAYGEVHGYGRGKKAGAAIQTAAAVAAANSRADAANERAKAAEAQAERYRKKSEGLDAIANQYLTELNHANDRADRTVADLRAGSMRFRKLWEGCKALPPSGQAATGPGTVDDGTDLQAASLGRIDRAVSACEAQVRGLQKVIQCDRGERSDCT